jgi:coproporphyrinogen III oxidase-like Fe-S oxidoreductase
MPLALLCDELLELGLLEWQEGRLRLTKPTYLIANQVFERFVGGVG